MGNMFAPIRNLFSKREMRIVMIGLDATGKSTVLCQFKPGKAMARSFGFDVETVEYNDLKFTVWDIGGQDKLRPLWTHYYASTDAVIFVVDSNDLERIDEVREELHNMLGDENLDDDVPLLVFANKQDLPNALSPEELTDKLGLRSVARDWYVQPASAVMNEGIFEGFDWMCGVLKRL
eukprot:TRINITY_DN2936_c0_g1_i13.p3 TRINITY_DN2936_c0_g1~~TRINITY_DN2936_c0_g1_i13.p3  ORF type:complete len:199 (+),score=47.80 TRINITY_DN2936_c0_g1_i13:66-599(+)